MDPNLEKIKDHHLKRIRRGKVQQALDDAHDYLLYVIGHNYDQVDLEMTQFSEHLRTLKRKKKNNGKRQQW